MTRTEYDVVALGELLIDFTAQGADLAAMWAERAPLYERFRDAAIDNSGTVEQTAQAIWRDFCENSGH